jgi:starch phosphorylase
MNDLRTIAYFTMEIGLTPGMPTYAGGLGVLAGDTIRSAADLGIPLVGMTLLHRKGYFYQRLDASGWQTEEPVNWPVDDFLLDTGVRVSVALEGRAVQLRAWQRDVTGCGGASVPVYFLDSDLPENAPADRSLTHFLYGGDLRHRLCQEVILGIGGVRMLRAIGHHEIQRYHMNEGHSALLTLELLRELREQDGRDSISPEDIESVHRQCVFTTHTPIPAGHDKFPLELVDQVLGSREACGIDDPICHEGLLNMTYLALSLSHYVNGVAKKHGEISRHMFAEYKIDAITNGVHASTWVSPPFRELFDRYVAGWEEDNFSRRVREPGAQHRVRRRRVDAGLRASRRRLQAGRPGLS